MNQDNIRTVLSYCKLDVKYFEVSRTFEALYFQQVYSSEIARRRIDVACYEQDHQLIALLQSRDIDCKLYDFWLHNHSSKKVSIYWRALFDGFYRTFDDVVNITIP